MSAADPYTALRELVPDLLTFRVLRAYCEHRRIDGDTPLERAIAIVVSRVRAGEIKLLIAEAAKPDAVWREERALQEVLRRALMPLGGHRPSEATLDSIRMVVEGACVHRYPSHARRYVRKLVRAAVSHRIGGRLEINGAILVAGLAGLSGLGAGQ